MHRMSHAYWVDPRFDRNSATRNIGDGNGVLDSRHFLPRLPLAPSGARHAEAGRRLGLGNPYFGPPESKLFGGMHASTLAKRQAVSRQTLAKREDGAAMLQTMKTKSLDPSDGAAVREHLVAVVQGDFAGNMSHAAKALGVSVTMVFDVLNEKRGAGIKLLSALAKHRDVPIEAILGRGTSSMSAEAMVIPGALSQVLDANPEWPTAVRAALRAVSDRDFAPAIWQRLGDDFARALRYAEMEQRSESVASTQTSSARRLSEGG